MSLLTFLSIRDVFHNVGDSETKAENYKDIPNGNNNDVLKIRGRN